MGWRGPSAWAMGVFFAAGCGDSGAAAPPRPDGGRQDASTGEDSGISVDAARRGDEPVLPPAELEVELPFDGPDRELLVDVTTDGARLDVFFSIDTTGSFDEEIDEVQTELESSIVPALRDRSADVAFGVGRFEDFPFSPYGATGDRPFALLTPITTERDRVGLAVATLDQPLGSGGDVPEAGYEALFQIATGEGYALDGTTIVEPFAGRGPGAGGAGFREGALRAVVHVTDAPPHDPGDYGAALPGTHGFTEAVDALRAEGIRVIGIASDESARSHLERLAIATSAVADPIDGTCATGLDGSPRAPVRGKCPLVFAVSSSGTGLGGTIVDALYGLLDSVSYERVHGETPEDRLTFVQRIEARDARTEDGVEAPEARDEDGDEIADTFRAVRPGTDLTFAVVLANHAIHEEDFEQAFRVEVEIRGDDLVLARRTLRLVVPSSIGAPRP